MKWKVWASAVLCAACLAGRAAASDLTEAAQAALPGYISYHELSGARSLTFAGRTVPYTAGQFVAELGRESLYVTGYVIFARTDPALGPLFAPYFRYGLDRETLAGLAALNKEFFDPEAALHREVEQSVAAWADQMAGGGAALDVKLADMEPVRRVGDVNYIMYTAGARILFSSEGLILPLYGRAYMYRDGDSYRVVTLITSDDSRAILGYALEDLAKEAGARADERNRQAFIASLDLSGMK